MGQSQQQQFIFTLYRFVALNGKYVTEVVRNLAFADGMRTLVDMTEPAIHVCMQRVMEWARAQGISIRALDPYPSKKYPGKAWLEFRIGGLVI